MFNVFVKYEKSKGPEFLPGLLVPSFYLKNFSGFTPILAQTKRVIEIPTRIPMGTPY
jgi:hypothetical protein